MFAEAIDSYGLAIDRYCKKCRDSKNAEIANVLRGSLRAMGDLAKSSEDAGHRLRESRDIGEQIEKRKAAIMARVLRLVPSLKVVSSSEVRGGTIRVAPFSMKNGNMHGVDCKGNMHVRPISADRRHSEKSLLPHSGRHLNPTDKKDSVMSEKDNEATKDFLASFRAMQEIEGELKKAENTLLSVLKARDVLRSLADVNARLDRIRIVDNAELKRIESRLQMAKRIKDAAISSASELNSNQSQLQLVERDIRDMKAGLESVRPSLEQAYKKWLCWKGSSTRTKGLLDRIARILARCDVDDSRKVSIRRKNAALYNDAAAIQRRWTSEVDILSRQLSQANTDRRNRATLLENLRKLVNDISNMFSRMTGRSAVQFVSSRSIEDGRSMIILAQNANPHFVFSTAITTRRDALSELITKCRMRQPMIEGFGKCEMNTTAVYPKHIICAEARTCALGGELSIPYSLPFPFAKSIVFSDSTSIAPFLIRLLYVLPAGKLIICAIDHKSAGENVGALNALCELNGQLQIVTSEDDVTPQFRELDELMGDMTRNVFSYKEKDWASYNANHPGSSLPLRVVPIYSMHGFGATQLDLVQKLLVNGPRFGIICILAGNAYNDLDDRLRGKFADINALSDRIDKNGARIAGYTNLSLQMSSSAIPPQRIGELAELYATKYREISQKPPPEIRFQDLFVGVDMWHGNATEGISAVIGWDDIGNPVNFEFGVGRSASAYHALVGGTTGSGKSVFLHTLIQSLANKYSPEELLFYLLDYKKGDEFKKYADARGTAWLPHVKMISRHRDPRFALELFDFLDQEFKRRSDQFGSYGDIVAYRKHGGKIPRIVIIIDEFQVMFEEYCGLNLSDEVARRLSTVFKQGRSYGIHLVLATQSLASLHFSGMAGILGQIGLRIALKGMANDGILADGNHTAEKIIPKRQCVVNPAFGLKDSAETINNIVTDVPFSDPAEVEECKRFRMAIISKAQERHMISSCRVFNGAALPMVPSQAVIAESLKSKKWNSFFMLLLGARTDFSSTPFTVDFTEEQREHLIVAGEDGNLSSDSEVHITGEDIWDGLRYGIIRSLQSMSSCGVLYYNPGVGDIPKDVPEEFIRLSGRSTETALLDAFREMESTEFAKKIVVVENFQDARLLHPSDAPRAFSSRPAEPQPETPRSRFASLFNGTENPKYHVIIMTKNFGFMNKEVLARSGAEVNILKGCAKRVVFNLSDDDLSAMIPHQKISDRRGPRRVWFEDMRTGVVTDFLPYGG